MPRADRARIMLCGVSGGFQPSQCAVFAVFPGLSTNWLGTGAAVWCRHGTRKLRRQDDRLPEGRPAISWTRDMLHPVSDSLSSPGASPQESALTSLPGGGQRNEFPGTAQGVVVQAGVVTGGVQVMPWTSPVVTPRELPADAHGFTGRTAELAELGLFPATRDMASSMAAISLLSGTAGVGKTALAVHWCHRVRDRFPDGQLYVDLRGYDIDQPVHPSEALAGMLRSLGVHDRDIPRETTERAGRYRSLVAGRRILIVLDNAQSLDQVCPLLPGTTSCVAVVTSRDTLAGLVARYGARRIELGRLPLAEAVSLLENLIGARVAADPTAAERLANQCARLPLALRLAAERVTARPAVTLADLAAELENERRRLDLLDAGGDDRTAVRAVFSWSYQQLAPKVAGAFRLLGLHPGRDVDLYGVAALAGVDMAEAEHFVDRLMRAHILEETSAGRYEMHDLLCAYAAGLAVEKDDDVARRSAFTRLLDHYRFVVAKAVKALYPHACGPEPRIPHGSRAPSPDVDDGARARAWLDAEHPNLIAAVAHAARNGWPAHACQIAAALSTYMDTGARYTDALVVHGHALHAAVVDNDYAGQGTVMNDIGRIYWRLGRYPESLEHLGKALTIRRQTGDRPGEATTLNNISINCGVSGRYHEALVSLKQALLIRRDIGDRVGEATTLNNLGITHRYLEDYADALAYLERALAIVRDIGDHMGEAMTLNHLGAVHSRSANQSLALGYHQDALSLARELRYLLAQGEALNGIGTVHHNEQRYDDALRSKRHALDIAHETANRCLQCEALNGIGDTLYELGRLDDARSSHKGALIHARELGDRYEQAKALDGIARVLYAMGDPIPARRHWEDSLATYIDLRVPCADVVRAKLNALGAGQTHSR